VIARETDISTLTRLLYIAYFLEVGLILLFVPWSVFWERNFFAESLPLVHAVVKNNFVRGAISGIGVLNLLAGLADLRTLIPWERR
jgi:polyferredoxin